MNLNLVSYSGREKFELDVSSIDPKDRSEKDRQTLFFSKNTTWKMSDSELNLLKTKEELKEYSRWCHVHKTKRDPFKKKVVKKVEPPKEDDSTNSNKKKKLKKKTD
ncbi:MAG: hypothetical protein KAS32_19685 [Candidatus Peribacteraceae bacterium]|nr:hypothetical protein [Candidatus Peribacteraceae bacterium]